MHPVLTLRECLHCDATHKRELEILVEFSNKNSREIKEAQ